MTAPRVGFIGKMPSADDFVEGGGAMAARHALRDWAGEGLRAGRSARGENRFTDSFLTMPLWRFAAVAGAWGPHSVAGVICPSMDRGGRAFPLIVVAETGNAPPLAAMSVLPPWFGAVEAMLLDALRPEAGSADFAARLPEPADVPQDRHARSCGEAGTLRGMDVRGDGSPRMDGGDLLSGDAARSDDCIWITLGAGEAGAIGLAGSGPPDPGTLVVLTDPPIERRPA